MADLTGEELDRIELYAAGDERVEGLPGASFCTKPADVLRLVAEVRRLREYVYTLELDLMSERCSTAEIRAFEEKHRKRPSSPSAEPQS